MLGFSLRLSPAPGRGCKQEVCSPGGNAWAPTRPLCRERRMSSVGSIHPWPLSLLSQPNAGYWGARGTLGLFGGSRGHHFVGSLPSGVQAPLVPDGSQSPTEEAAVCLAALGGCSRPQMCQWGFLLSSLLLFCFSLGSLLTAKPLMRSEGMETSYCSN